MNLKNRQTCRACGNKHLKEVIDLGEQFLQGSFEKDGFTKPSLRKIPTKLVRCDGDLDENACGLVQMSVTTPPSILYSNYWYKSGISKTMRDHLESIVNKALSYTTKTESLKVLDIACNDGTLLSFYNPNVIKFGVDPSDIANKVSLPNTTIINDLFPSKQLKSPIGGFDIITSIAMFYDLEDPVDFCKSIRCKLSQTGIWMFEVAYLPFTLEQVSYDTIVGEHIEYYSLSSLEYILSKAGLRIFKAELNDVNGGSILCYATHEDNYNLDSVESKDSLKQIRLKEFDMELDTDKPYEVFRSKVKVQKYELIKLLKQIHNDGKVVHLYGASTKCNTLLQYCEIDNRIIPYAAERSPEKFGAKTLGTNIKIISEEESRAMKPDYYLVGPWHFKTEILEREKDSIKNGIKFIFPLPELKIYG